MKYFRTFVNSFKTPVNAISLFGVAALFPILIYHSVISFYVRYIADDFCTASTVVNGRSWWDAQLWWYVEWSGRFSYTAIVTALEMPGVWVASIWPTVSLLLWLAALSWLVFQTLKALSFTPTLPTSLLLSLAILSMYLMTNPHIGQTFYWLTGNVTYTLPLIFLTVAAGLAASLYNRIADQKKSFSAYWRSKEGAISLITGVVLFITASLNETHAFYQLLVLGLAFVLFVLVQGVQSSKKLFALSSVGLWIVLSLISTIIMYVAPGNDVRAASFPPNPTITKTLEYAFNAANSYLITEWSYPWFVYLLLMGLAIGCLLPKVKQIKKTPIEVLERSLVVLVIAYVLCVAVYIPSFYVQHYPTSERSLSSMPFTLACAALLIGLLLSHQVVFYLNKFIHKKYSFALVLFGIFVVLIKIAYSQSFMLMNDVQQISPELQRYAESWDKQSQFISEHGKDDRVEVGRLGRTFDLEDTSSDPKHWINNCMTRFYGVKEIIAE